LASSITLEGIDKALENLGYYSKSTPKSRFVKTLRYYYKNSDDLNKIQQIPVEVIVSQIWDIPLEDKSKINSRKKNALSLKNTINKDLQKLFDSGLNPEGIIINDSNIFSMSDNAREKLLSSFTEPFAGENEISLSQISQVLNSIKELLQKNMEKNLDQSGFDSIQSLISDIEKSFEEKSDSQGDSGEESGKKTVTIELDEGEEIEEVFEDEDDEEIVELSEDEEIASDLVEDEPDNTELIEIDEDDELLDEEEIDEEIIEEQDQLSQEDEFEEVEDEELIELDEDEELVEADEIELGEDDELVDEEHDFDEQETDEDLSEEDLLSQDDEFEEIEDDELIELDEDEELVEADEIEAGEDEEFTDQVNDFNEETVSDDLIEEFDELSDDEEDVLDIDEKEFDDTELVELGEDEELADYDNDFEEEAIDEDLIEELDELSDDEEIVTGIDEDDDTELVEIDDDEDFEDTEEAIELDDDEELVEADEIELGEDEELADENEDEHRLPELGLPAESLGEFESYLESQNIDSKNLLSEKFDSYLGAMDRYYNQFLIIKKNTYRTGCPYPSSDLKPESKTDLNEFFIGAFPITNALFEIFIEKTGYKTTAEEKGFSTVFESRYKSEFDYKTGKQKSILSSTGKSSIIRGACWYQPFGPGSGLHKKRSHPVVHISLKDALSFAAWIGKRLPTEDEWEAAARTDKGFPFPWGSQWIENACNTENCGKGDTSPVDEYIEGINSNKISDTLGNVWEWTTSSIEKAEKTFYIAKGGSFVSDQRVRLWSRYFVKPDFTSNILGFRCVAD
jgi:formylglycine-generating enzyme required for sulfatase activity